MGLLQNLGYTNLREYAGGMADWTESGGPIESGAQGNLHAALNENPSATSTERSAAAQGATGGSSPRAAHPSAPVTSTARAQVGRRTAHLVRPIRGAARAAARSSDLLEALANQSVRRLLLIWLGMVVGFGGAYWIASALTGRALLAGGEPVAPTWDGLVTAIYFSFVTATSVGYGDVVPLGLARGLAIAEAAAGLLLFGCVISKLVSRRQEELIEEIHRTTFEEKLGLVRTNLHLVLSELQAIAAMCADPRVSAERVHPRVESAVLVFASELRSIHDLLYHPKQVPDEQVLEALLANLAAALRELCDLLTCLPASVPRSSSLDSHLAGVSSLASEICGECVPRDYAPALKEWMDRIQALAKGLAAP